MSDVYRCPITNEYHTRGCIVNINAAKNNSGVDITVRNIKTGNIGRGSYIFRLHPEGWYAKSEILKVQNIVNDLLDKYGDNECLNIHSTNQILS